MHLARLVCSLALGISAVTMTAPEVKASHFRFGHITWKALGNLEVEFRFVAAWRRTGFAGPGPFTGPGGLPGVGDVIVEAQGATQFQFGDGNITPTLRFRVTSIDVANDWMLGVALQPGDDTKPTISHTYPDAAPRIAGVFDCCRIFALRNRSNTNYRLATQVHPGGTNSSPVSDLPPIVGCPIDQECKFLVPAADTDANTKLTFRLSTDFEATGLNGRPSPPGMTIDADTGIVTWTPSSGFPTFTAIGQLWTVQVIIEERDATTNAITTFVPVDFILRITGFVPPLPVCQINPAGPSTAFVGSPFQLSVLGATVHAGQTVTVNAAALPSGAVMNPGLPATSAPIPGSGSFIASQMSWTPTLVQVGPNVLTFSVFDSFGQQVICSTTINVISNRPPVITCNDPVTLWSPTHDLADVSSAFSVSDPDHDPVTLTIRMFSDESEVPETGDGSGRTAPDFKDELGGAGRGLLVRAERQGIGTGRWYIAVITADDGRGGITTEACLVAVVPHDQDPASQAAILAEANTALAAFQTAVINDSPLPIAGTSEHGLADPIGNKQ